MAGSIPCTAASTAGPAPVRATAWAGAARAAAVSLVDGTLRDADMRGEADVPALGPSVLGPGVFDDAAPLRVGRACGRHASRRVLCPSMPAPARVETDGGAGDDLIEGGIAGDRLDGSAGSDTVMGGADRAGGTDLLQGGTAGAGRDPRVRAGGGRGRGDVAESTRVRSRPACAGGRPVHGAGGAPVTRDRMRGVLRAGRVNRRSARARRANAERRG